jgi:hypothetical protein
MTDREQFLYNVAAFIEYKKEEGFQTLELSPETLAQLKPAAGIPTLRGET